MKLIRVKCIKKYKMKKKYYENGENRVAFKKGKKYVFLQYECNKFVGFDDLDSNEHKMDLINMQTAFDMENVEEINIDNFLKRERKR